MTISMLSNRLQGEKIGPVPRRLAPARFGANMGGGDAPVKCPADVAGLQNGFGIITNYAVVTQKYTNMLCSQASF